MKEIIVSRAVPTWKIGKKIRDVRLWTNCTQAELGKKIGLSQSELSRIELGKDEADVKTIERICSKFYGLTVENFTEDKPIEWNKVY